MYHRLKSFLDKNNILFKSQYGFREKHPHIQPYSWHNTVKTLVFTCGIFIDLKKAFDTFDHAIWLQKLNYYASGIRGIFNDWFSSYLLGRSQATEVDTYLSSKSQISCEVSQVSVLGPLLFLIYINDIYNSSDALSFYLFADDWMTLTCCMETKIWNLWGNCQ